MSIYSLTNSCLICGPNQASCCGDYWREFNEQRCLISFILLTQCFLRFKSEKVKYLASMKVHKCGKISIEKTTILLILSNIRCHKKVCILFIYFTKIFLLHELILFYVSKFNNNKRFDTENRLKKLRPNNLDRCQSNNKNLGMPYRYELMQIRIKFEI